MARLVLVHGFTQTARSWDRIAATLRAEGHEVLTPDLAGHAGVPPASVADAATAIATGAGRRATYVGYSMGGRTCMQLALDHPTSVDGLVLIGATAGIEDDDERAARRSSDEALADRIEAIGVAPFIDEWLAQPLFATLPPDAAQREDRLRNTPEGLAGALRLAGTGAQAPLWARLGPLRDRGLPVLIVTGSEDAKFMAQAERLTSTIGRSAQHAVVPGAGHAAHLEQPDVFVGLLRSWLEHGR